MPMIWRRWASRSASRCRALSASLASCDAALRAPQRAREQELVPAVGAVELQLRGLVAGAPSRACRSRSWAAARGPGRCPASPPPAAAPAAGRCCSCAGRRSRALGPGGCTCRGGCCPGGGWPGGQLARPWAGGRAARADAARLGLRPRPPAPALRQRVGDRQAERHRGAQRQRRRQACRSPSGSAFTHWKIPSLAEPRGAGILPNFPGADYGMSP